MQLVDVLDELTATGELFEPSGENGLRCLACAHRCRLQPDRRGICKVRFNRGGELRVPWGYVAGLQVDPVEKKPFAHLFPGASALTFGMLGCDFHCSFCQNWLSSQTLRDPQAGPDPHWIQRLTPEQIVQVALRSGAELVVSSYNEPLITAEWAAAIFGRAQAAGLRCAFVSNGNATPEALAYLRPYLTAYKIDLKSMQEQRYREMGGVLQNVLDTIQNAAALGLWVEVVTLVIPGFNDDPAELWDAARFIAAVSRDIPWHVTAFHPDYRMTAAPATQAAALQQAAEIGQEAGLNYVYAGNLPGRVGSLEDTHCPACRRVLVERRGYSIRAYHITAQGTCPTCGAVIAGRWSERPEQVRLFSDGFPKRVR